MRNAFRGNQTVWFEREKFDCQQFFTNENERVQPAVFGTMLCYQSFTKHTLSSFWSASYISMEDTVDKRWYFLRYLNIVISRNVTHWKLYNIKYKSQGEVPTEAMTNCNENFGWTLQNDINFLPTVADGRRKSIFENLRMVISWPQLLWGGASTRINNIKSFWATQVKRATGIHRPRMRNSTTLSN